MDLVVTLVLVVAGVAVAGAFVRTFGAMLLRLATWVLVAMVALGAIAGEPVPPVVVVMALVCWVGSHVLFKLRHGYWRSRFVASVMARRAPRPAPSASTEQ
jgi:hypothetical protein